VLCVCVRHRCVCVTAGGGGHTNSLAVSTVLKLQSLPLLSSCKSDSDSVERLIVCTLTIFSRLRRCCIRLQYNVLLGTVVLESLKYSLRLFGVDVLSGRSLALGSMTLHSYYTSYLTRMRGFSCCGICMQNGHSRRC
jgi:hypothetical protein